MFCIVDDTEKVLWSGSSKVLVKKLFERDNVYYQENITRLWSAQELAEINVYRFEQPKVPEGYLSNDSLVDTLNGYTITRKGTWIVDPNYVAPDPLKETLASKITEVKAEAGRRIVSLIPEWKQRNLTARAALLAIKGQANWTQAEADEFAVGALLWDAVTNLRTASNLLESNLNSMTLEELQNFVVTDDLNWS